ncbi:MAG: primosomal protein N' [Parcubacteria group bacterium]|nr:primosomal protein N' [Parcubacteria group bacterium]
MLYRAKLQLMHVIEVTPLVSIPKSQNQTFSYFWPESLNAGDLVFAPVRNKKTLAVVLRSTPLAKQKIMLKKMAGFALKKLLGLKKADVITKKQIEFAIWLSNYYFAPLGLCMKLVLPKFWKNTLLRSYGASEGLSPKKDEGYSANQNKPKKENIKEDFFIDGDIKKYFNYIDPNGQTLILVPQKISIPIIQKVLSEYKSVGIHGNLTIKEQFKTHQEIQNGISLIIGTRTALFYNYPNLKSIIVHDAGSENYYSDMTPKYFAPKIVKKLAQLNNANIVLAGFPFPDLLPKAISKKIPQIKKLASNLEVVDMVKEIQHGNFSFLSQTLTEKIKDYIINNDRVILFSHRRGYSLYICRACGKTVSCDNCSVAMTIHHGDAKTYLLCHRCQAQKPVPQFCPSCENYALKPYGFGSERIAKEIQKLLPESKIFLLDQDNVKEENGLSVIKKWLETPSILIATSMLFSFKDFIREERKKLKIVSGIIGLDQLMQFPDFRMNNKILKEVYSIRKLSDQTILQTIDSKTEIINALDTQTYNEFLKKDLENRQIMNYPPFGQIIKIESKNINEGQALHQARNLTYALKKLKPDLINNGQILGPVPALISKEKDKYIFNVLIRIPFKESEEQFENEIITRNQILNMIGSNFEILVDPKNPL